MDALLTTAKTIYRHFDMICNLKEEKKWHDAERNRILRLSRIETHRNCVLQAEIALKKQQIDALRLKNESFLRVLTQEGSDLVDSTSDESLSIISNELSGAVYSAETGEPVSSLAVAPNARCSTCQELLSDCDSNELPVDQGDSILRPYVAKAFFIR